MKCHNKSLKLCYYPHLDGCITSRILMFQKTKQKLSVVKLEYIGLFKETGTVLKRTDIDLCKR